MKQWPLVTVLAWIVTRDEKYALEQRSSDVDEAEIALSLVRGFAGRAAGKTLMEAWVEDLAPAMADRRLSALCDRETTTTSTRSDTICGVIFPPVETPTTVLRHDLVARRRGETAIVPADAVGAHTVVRWINASFDSDIVKATWQPEGAIADTAPSADPDAPSGTIKLQQARRPSPVFDALMRTYLDVFPSRNHGTLTREKALSLAWEKMKETEPLALRPGLQTFKDVVTEIRATPADAVARDVEQPITSIE